MKAMQKGFTLVELVVVIVILGILAATALPRFINVATDARIAAMNGMAGGIRSAVTLAQSRYLATGNVAATTVNMGVGGAVQAVDVAAGTGIPAGTATGIQAAMQNNADGFTFTCAAGVCTVIQTGGPAACLVTYTGATGVVTTTALVAANCGG
ncbi:MAG: prepilin-type N-terminal cleavage/methylation domain-containing protein [Azonexus sp.]|nr:prepilin-type N-terminal cleavage/methylation domain-containing protein [Azonexus sp.]